MLSSVTAEVLWPSRVFSRKVFSSRDPRESLFKPLQGSRLWVIAVGQRELKLLGHLQAQLVEHRREIVGLSRKRRATEREEEWPPLQQFMRNLQVAPRAGAVRHFQPVWVTNDPFAVRRNFVGAKSFVGFRILDDWIAA